MSRIGFFIIALALSGAVFAAETTSSTECEKNEKSTEKTGLTTESENNDKVKDKTTETVQGTTEEDEESEKEVCFDLIGCFHMGKPWKYTLRPIPKPRSPQEQPVRLLFYTRPNTNEEFVITTYPEVELNGAPFDPKKPTAIVTHGFSNNGSVQWLHDLKDAYLSKVDANFMITDWGPGAQSMNYLQVTGNTRVVARLIAKTLKYLMENHGLEKQDLHIIGHSLGAQISSYVGKEIPGIARLTALDPAQPAFEGYDKEVRLDKSDAEFVDVIHTDAKPFIPTLGFGMVKPHGHIDFYMNGGFEQPGCIVPDGLPKITGLLDLAEYPVEYLSKIKECNHGRAYRYLIEAFNETGDCTFWGHKATAPEIAKTLAHTFTQALLPNITALSPHCTKNDCAPLGFKTKQSRLRGVFVVTTNNEKPYCISEAEMDMPKPEEEPANESATEKESISPFKKATNFARKSIENFEQRIKGAVPFFK